MPLGADNLKVHPIVESPEEVSTLTSVPAEFVDTEEQSMGRLQKLAR
jgi:hypothetical protein